MLSYQGDKSAGTVVLLLVAGCSFNDPNQTLRLTRISYRYDQATAKL